MLRLAIAFTAIPLALVAQETPRFEVASIKPFVETPTAGRGGGCTGFHTDRGRVDVCAPLSLLIAYAYRIPRDRIVGPDWLMSRRADRFLIAAKLSDGATAGQTPEMLQALLAERFKVAVHRATREEAITALVVAKGGLRLAEALPGADDAGAIDNPIIGPVHKTISDGFTYRWQAPDITLAGLAALCSEAGFVPPVVDMTGLKGRYQVDLTVSLNDTFAAAQQAREDAGAADSARADMRDAMLASFNDGLRKLGLQLERRKGTVETLIVDSAEKAPTAN